MMDKKDILVITGPTATGKSELAVKKAKETNAEIISADAFQVYRYMDIGTAKVSEKTRETVPHHLIDIREPDESYSVADFLKLTCEIIKKIRKKNKNIIICGGTGFYINAFLYNYTFTDDTTNTAIKSHLLKESEKYGPVKMWERLNIIDPASARIIDPNNNKRVIRALEIYEHTKIPPSSFRKKSDAARKDTKIIGLTAPRELVYQRINNRVDQMIDTGLIDEVRQLLDMGYHQKLQAFEALGYKEAASYLTGSIEKQEMIELIKLKTRQFAKRQITWFKRFNNVHWINIT